MKKGCKVCRSPNVKEYERLWSDEGVIYTELTKIAKEKFNENICAMTFHRHMTRCLPNSAVEDIPKGLDNVSLSGKELNSLGSLREAKQELETIINIASKAFKLRPTPQTLTALSNAFDRKRAYLETIDRLEKEDKANQIVDDKRILEVLLWATDYMCPGCQKLISQKVVERLKNGDMGTSPEVQRVES